MEREERGVERGTEPGCTRLEDEKANSERGEKSRIELNRRQDRRGQTRGKEGRKEERGT